MSIKMSTKTITEYTSSCGDWVVRIEKKNFGGVTVTHSDIRHKDALFMKIEGKAHLLDLIEALTQGVNAYLAD